MNPETQDVASAGPSTRDTAMLVLAILLLLGGMFAFYYFTSQYNVLIRALMLVGATIAAIVISAQTVQGRGLWGVMKGANIERRKVVWPSRQESVQTTL